MRDARPAAAADASRWPMFAFRDVHWTEGMRPLRRVDPHRHLQAAPTCDEIVSIGYPADFDRHPRLQSDLQARSRCHELPMPAARHRHPRPLPKVTLGMPRWAQSNSRWIHPARPQNLRAWLHSHLQRTNTERKLHIPHHDSTHWHADQTCGIVHATRSFQQRTLQYSQPH